MTPCSSPITPDPLRRIPCPFHLAHTDEPLHRRLVLLGYLPASSHLVLLRRDLVRHRLVKPGVVPPSDFVDVRACAEQRELFELERVSSVQVATEG